MGVRLKSLEILLMIEFLTDLDLSLSTNELMTVAIKIPPGDYYLKILNLRLGII